MKKVVIATFALIMLLSMTSFATSTRTLVMGDNDRVLVDDGNMFRYPGRTYNYPNLALGEFDQSSSPYDFYNFGITWQFSEDNPWVLGTFVSLWPDFGPEAYNGANLARFPYYSGYMYPDFSSALSSEELTAEGYPRRIQLLYARQLGGNNFGFGLDVVRAKWEMNQDSTAIVPVNYQAEQSFSEYRFSVGLTEGTSGQWDIAASFMTGTWTDVDTAGQTLTEPNGFYEFGLSGRYFLVYNPKVTFVPHAELAIGKRGTDDHVRPNYFLWEVYTDSTWTREYTGTMIDLGFGMNYTSGPNMLGVVDFGFMYQQLKLKRTGNGYDNRTLNDPTDSNGAGEEKDSYLVLPYLKIGFEGEVFSWMDIRAGGQTQLFVSKEKYESDWEIDETYDINSNETYLGVGLHFGRLHLDTYTDPQLVLDGFNFISGSTDAEHMNFSVSLLYELF